MTNWTLYFGDGDSTLSLTNIIDSISHAFDTCNVNGIFTATYIISDANSCSDTDSISFNIYCPPSIDPVLSDVENVCLSGASAFSTVLQQVVALAVI